MLWMLTCFVNLFSDVVFRPNSLISLVRMLLKYLHEYVFLVIM